MPCILTAGAELLVLIAHPSYNMETYCIFNWLYYTAWRQRSVM